MSLLAILGLVSLVLIVIFTLVASRGQWSQRAAIIESWINIGVGFAVSYAMNWLLFPLVGAHLTAIDNWHIGCIYTLVSILRSYAIRLWCADRIHLLAARAAERLS